MSVVQLNKQTQSFTQSQSLTVVRNLIRFAVATIAYGRGFCESNSFQGIVLLELPVIQMVDSSPESAKMLHWMEGAFDALNKGYLKQMCLCVFNEDCTKTLEAYTFHIAYDEHHKAKFNLSVDEDSACRSRANMEAEVARPSTLTATKPESRISTREKAQEAMHKILMDLVNLMGALPPLLCDKVIAMRLLYYDDITPKDYEPPQFSAADRNMYYLYRKEQLWEPSRYGMTLSHHSCRIDVRHPIIHKARKQDKLCLSAPLSTEEETGQTLTLPSVNSGEREESPQSLPPHEMRGAAFSKKQMDDVGGAAASGSSANYSINSFQTHSSGTWLAKEETCEKQKHTMAGKSRACFPAEIVDTIPPMEDLAATPRVYRLYEQGFVLIALWVYRNGSYFPAGRGGFSEEALNEFVENHLSCEFSVKFATSVVERLSREGHVCEERRHGRMWWRVCGKLPAYIMRKFIGHAELSAFLSPHTLHELQEHIKTEEDAGKRGSKHREVPLSTSSPCCGGNRRRRREAI